MRILSLNGNGIRACLKKGLVRWWESTDADLLLFQEVRFDDAEALAAAFPGCWTSLHAAEKKGYSGVAVISKQAPKAVVHGMGDTRFDGEGRVMRVDFDGFSVLNVYFPSGASKPERQAFKLEFLQAFWVHVQELQRSMPNLLIGADWNMCHRAIDIHNPIRLDGVPGFTPEERAWLDGLHAAGWRDAFRLFSDEPDQYTWWSLQSKSRERNVGWRIDGFWLSPSAVPGASRCVHLSKAFLSDHCPVLLEWDLPTTFE
jgi:exodeoxyribonuclease-3